jgi:hypothetical protein
MGCRVRVGFGSLTVDDLLITAPVLTTEESHPEFHQMRRGHVRYFADGPREKLISDSLAQEKAMWPVVERVSHRCKLEGY